MYLLEGKPSPDHATIARFISLHLSQCSSNVLAEVSNILYELGEISGRHIFIDGAIHRAAGPELLAECRTLHGCETGEAKITKAYNLPCDYVIHTVGPIWNGGRNREEELLANCYFNSMKLAMDNGIRSIAFPSISTGVYSFPVELAAKIAVHTVNRFLQDNPDCFDLAEWVLFDAHTESVYEAEVEQQGCKIENYGGK